MEKTPQTFEQSKYKMQRLNFFVVQQSLEWNTVMQIGRGAAIMGAEIWSGHGLAAHKPDTVPVI